MRVLRETITKVLLKLNSTNFSFLLHQSSHFVKEGWQVGQVLLPLSIATKTIANHLPVLLMFGNGFTGELAPSSSQGSRWGWAVCKYPDPPVLLEGKSNTCFLPVLKKSLQLPPSFKNNSEWFCYGISSLTTHRCILSVPMDSLVAKFLKCSLTWFFRLNLHCSRLPH